MSQTTAYVKRQTIVAILPATNLSLCTYVTLCERDGLRMFIWLAFASFVGNMYAWMCYLNQYLCCMSAYAEVELPGSVQVQ